MRNLYKMSLMILELKTGFNLIAGILDLVLLFDHLESKEGDVVSTNFNAFWVWDFNARHIVSFLKHNALW